MEFPGDDGLQSRSGVAGNRRSSAFPCLILFEIFRLPGAQGYRTLMNADERRFFDSLTERVLGAIFEVANTLGAGFLEKVYERALLKERSILGIQAVSQASFPVTYKGECVGEYYADILVENVLVVELKCVERLASQHTAQCLNYLRASGRNLCLLVNFQRPTVEWKRVVHRFESSDPLCPSALTSAANTVRRGVAPG
jgi:GxxExxY protein